MRALVSTVIAVGLALSTAAPVVAAPLVPDLGPALVSVSEANRIVKGGGGTLQNQPTLDRNTPAYVWDGPELPDSCRNTVDPTRAYGVTYTAYRTVSYMGPDDIGISQTVAVYPSAQSARQVYDSYVANLQDCEVVYQTEELGAVPVISLVPGDPNSAVVEQPGTGAGQDGSKLFQVYGSAVFSVTAANFPDDAAVLWAMSERIQQNLDAMPAPSVDAGP